MMFMVISGFSGNWSDPSTPCSLPRCSGWYPVWAALLASKFICRPPLRMETKSLGDACLLWSVRCVEICSVYPRGVGCPLAKTGRAMRAPQAI